MRVVPATTRTEATERKRGNIRSYLMEGRATETTQEQELETSNKEEPILEPDNNGNERMNMMRGKMLKSRKRQELLMKRSKDC